MKRKLLTFGVIFFIAGSSLWSQEIQTAAAFFDRVSERYGEIEDYSAHILITNTAETEDQTVTEGTIVYRTPNQVRIDFDEPTGQVLVSDGEILMVYIPVYNVVLQQNLRRRSEESLAGMVNEQGLNLLSRNYSIAYLDVPEPVPLNSDGTEGEGEPSDDIDDEMVIKLKLDWRSTNEGYRQLFLSINEDLLIRRIVGVTVNYEEVQFDFTDIRLNQGIPEARFDYDPPASANLFTNFLFEGEG